VTALEAEVLEFPSDHPAGADPRVAVVVPYRVTMATRRLPAVRFCPDPQVEATEGEFVALEDARVGVPTEETVTNHQPGY